jgi:hypothetical protein
MLDEGTFGTGTELGRTQVDGTAAAARERSRELRLQLSAHRARLAQLRGVGRDDRLAGAPDVFKQVQEQLQQAHEQIGHLETALATNRRIGMAIGIVMARDGLTDEQAFELLRTQSQLRNRKLRDLAEDVIYTGTL